ncbi:protein NDR1-like [Canna indica]|uniref:Protein NDR1-like n=1 Tax=Canna indica TaxID=4628 RepID=A0AAQ3L4F6_9LILI|nr:protein NDR1-like [Canna indica]
MAKEPPPTAVVLLPFLQTRLSSTATPAALTHPPRASAVAGGATAASAAFGSPSSLPPSSSSPPSLPEPSTSFTALSALPSPSPPSADLLTSRLDFSVTARNPNRKLIFLYDDVAVEAASDGVTLGEGTIPGFEHGADNTTVLKATVLSSGQSLNPAEASNLRKKK